MEYIVERDLLWKTYGPSKLRIFSMEASPAISVDFGSDDAQKYVQIKLMQLL
jgi:hypothetical protein